MELQGETRQLPSYRRMLASHAVPTLTVLAHPRIERVGERAVLVDLIHEDGEGGRVELSRLSPGLAQPGSGSALPLATQLVSRRPLVLSSPDDGRVALDANALPEGAVRLDGVALGGRVELERERLEAGVVIELGTQVVMLLHLSAPELPDEGGPLPRLGLVGDSDALRDVRKAIVRAARQTGPVLVRGETGTGKELVAGALHQASARREGPYLAVNMAAVPPTLAASELFGHTKGSFSGAHQNSVGLFGRAHGGTLFMDEIGDTPLDVQAALLRVMETGEVQQVGADRVKQVDVRVIAATDADLEALIAQGRFRAPLRYRLSNLEIHIPPLRARKDDIGRLLVHFIATELAAHGRSDELEDRGPDGTSWIPAALVARLGRYAWPGNVRQLRNVARWLAGLDHRARPVDPEDPTLATLLVGEERAPVSVPEAEARAPGASVAKSGGHDKSERRKSALALVSPEELERLMEANDYKLGAVADALGVSRPALNDLVDAHPRLKRAQNLTLEELVQARAECGEIDRMWRHLKVSEKSLKLRMSALGLLD